MSSPQQTSQPLRHNPRHPPLHPYTPPPFAQPIAQHAPKYRLKLCMTPTPIQPLPITATSLGTPPLPPTVTLSIKRDDLTGCATTGNKLRKLEFLLAHAIATQHDSVITAGSIQSNHARATVVAAREAGLTPHVFLRAGRTPPNAADLPADGNLLMHKLLGAHIHLVKRMPYETGLRPRMEQLAKQLYDTDGSKAYLIGIGGSDPVGLWGYITAFDELLKQDVPTTHTHLALAAGSGGTTAGLAIANYLAGTPLRIVAFTVSDTPDYFYDHVDAMLTAVGLRSRTCSRDIVTIVEAKGKGYGVNSDDDFRTLVAVASETGIVFDGSYTLKALRGVKREIDKEGCGVFGSDARILFLHTGGLFGAFDRRVEPFLDDSLAKVCE